MKIGLLTIILGAVFGVSGFYDSQVKPPVAVVLAPLPSVSKQQDFLLPVTQANYLPIRDFNIPEPSIQARSAILIDGTSGRILFEKNPDQKLPIASITKLMTAIVALENFNMDNTYTVAEEDLNLDGLGADFMHGERFQGTELMNFMLVQSSNDAASVFASHARREGIDFVGLMNQKATSLGMASTHFSDPAGLNDAETYATASDVAKLIRAAMNHPHIRSAVTAPRLTVLTLGGITHRAINTNKLLALIPHILLGKTGYTEGARGTMALAVRIDDANDLISVVLGSEDRFGETKKLIDWGKSAHQWSH